MTEGRRRFALFLLVGGFAALVNIVSRIFFSMALPFEAAIVAAYLCGMTVAFALNKAFVFAPSGRKAHEEYGRFAIVNLVALAQVWLVSEGLARIAFPAMGFAWYPDTVAHIVGVAVPVFTSYAGHKHFSFAVKG